MNKPYPNSLKNPPLIEMIIEYRFNSTLPDEALFGLYYPIIKEYFSNYNTLPIMNIPLEARNTDISLMYQPHYHFYDENNGLSLLIGPRVLTFKYERFREGKINQYPGWRNSISKFSSELTNEIFKKLELQNIERLGIRYIDFFENLKLGEYITPSFSFPNRELERLQVTCSIQEDEILHNINLSDSAEFKHFVNNELRIHMVGSLIDVDSEYIPKDLNEVLPILEDILTKMHDDNKNLFYEIMKNELVEKYNPIYEEKK